MKIESNEVTYVDHMGTDLSVVNAARVSFAKESWWEEDGCLKMSDQKLIRYLAKHKHYSPFNHTFLTVRVKAPIYVARQLVKHEYMPWNEVSRRYVKADTTFAPMTFRMAADNVKQGSGAELDEATQSLAQEAFWESVDKALETYEYLLEIGVCPEQARCVLPINLNTEWYWSGTLKAFHKMLSLRLDPHTQKESYDIAAAIRGIALPLFPVSLDSLLAS